MHSLSHSLATLAWISLAAALILLNGCSSTKDTVLPQNGPSMKAIYDAHFTGMAADDPTQLKHALGGRPIGNAETDLAGYSRTAHTELDTLFPRLPNPTLVMYIFPHLAGTQRTPVPGYATTFTLYERVEYALPGEVSSETPSGQR